MAPTAFLACARDAPVYVVATFGDDEGSNAETLELAASVARARFAFPERATRAAEQDGVDGDGVSRAMDSRASSTSTSGTRAKTERFTLCLTREDGTRVVGVVRRVDGGRAALVALSRNPWFEYYHDVLEGASAEAVRVLSETTASARGAAEARRLGPDDALYAYLDRVMGAKTPTAGTETTVGLPWTAFAGVATQSVRLRAPDLSREFNGGIKFTSVLDCGHVDAVLALFAALVHERRVVVTSARLEALSGAVQAANAALYPLSWQHIFLPVLPESFLDYLTAPMPFLVGVHASLVPEMKKLPCDDVFVLNLDDGSFTYFEEDFDAMPSGPLTLLRVGLLREIERSRGEDSQAIARVFRTFFSSTLGPYKAHIKGVWANPPPKDAIVSDSLWLDQREFMESSKHADVLAAMRGTQMYEVFVRQRLKMCAREARKTGFVPMGDEIVDFDLDEPELTLSDVMMRGQALSAQFASASSHAFSVGSSVFKSTMQKAKHAYSTSKTIQDMRKAFASKKNQLAASIGKLREKSSEDLAAKWAEWTEDGAVRNLSFETQPAASSQPPKMVRSRPTSPEKVETTKDDAPPASPAPSPAPSPADALASAVHQMSFDDENAAGTAPDAKPPPSSTAERPIMNLIDL